MFSHAENSSCDDAPNRSAPRGARDWKTYSPAYNSAFLAALLIQGLFLLFGALLLDGGHFSRGVWIAVLGSWAATWIILFRRPMNPTATDLLIVKYAFLAMLIFVTAFGWPLVQLLGLER